MAWERAERDDAHDLAGPRLPETLTARRAQIVHRRRTRAIEQFDQAVGRYNEAIAQFPAVLLAWLFGFKPGRGVRSSGAASPRRGRWRTVNDPAGAPGGPPSSAPLWRLLQAAADVVAAVRERPVGDRGAGQRATPRCAPARRPWRSRRCATSAAPRPCASCWRGAPPPPPADALLCTALALCWREADAPYEVFTLVDQAVEAAKRSSGDPGPGQLHQRLPAPLPARARRAGRARPTATRWRAGTIRAGGSSG